MSRPKNFCAALLGICMLWAAAAPVSAHDDRARRRADNAPLVIGHRGGASGYLPEHTLEAYALGIALGADYVEPDLVATRDGHLIARHEPNLIDTTNVRSFPEFADAPAHRDAGRRGDRRILRERLHPCRRSSACARSSPSPDRDQDFNGRFRIPTLEEVIELVKRKSREEGRRIGIYPETKHPTYHQSIGLPLEDRLLAVLGAAGWNHRNAPVFIQSFETANLRYLRTRTSVRLIQLVDANDVKPDGSLDFSKPYDKPYDWVVSGREGLFQRPVDAARPAGSQGVCRRHRPVEAVPDLERLQDGRWTAPASTSPATAWSTSGIVRCCRRPTSSRTRTGSACWCTPTPSAASRSG